VSEVKNSANTIDFYNGLFITRPTADDDEKLLTDQPKKKNMKRTLLALVFALTTIGAKANDTTFYFTTSDAVKLYVRVAGQGDPCLFVHGGPGSTSYYFEAMPSAKLLEQHLKLVYFDQRGSGRSGSPIDSNYTRARFSKDIEELRGFLKVKKWDVMGHSFAGILLTDYATRYPLSIRSLLYINATVDIKSSMESHVNFGIKELGLSDSFYTNLSVPVEQRVWKVHEKLSEKDLWYKLMYRNAFEKKLNDSVTLLIGKFNRDFASKVWGIPEFSTNMSKLTSNIKMPVFVMTGDRDFAIGIDHYKRYQFPNKKIVHYIGGHAPFQEEPQWFAEKVIDFISALH
jgi:proline iminopeptidase